MNKSDQIRFTQWVDGELNDEEVRDLLAAQPGLRQERELVIQLGSMLRSAHPRREVPYPDFLNNQVKQRLEEVPAAENVAASPSDHPFLSILVNILTSPRWVASLAVSAAVMLMFLLLAATSSIRNYSEVVHTYTPHQSMIASSAYNDQAGVTIITIDGMTALPPTVQISGYFPASSERDAMLASTTLYDEEHRPILMVSTGSAGQPSFHHFSH